MRPSYLPVLLLCAGSLACHAASDETLRDASPVESPRDAGPARDAGQVQDAASDDQDAAATPGDAGADEGDAGASSDAAAPEVPDAGDANDAASPEEPIADAGTDAGVDPAPLKPAVIAHRGASGYAPEHTFAAYDMALAMGADYIEQDIAITQDGVLVCLHDGTLNRTARGEAANCSGTVASKTLAQLKTCDMGSWFNEAYPSSAKPEYVGLQIPTLEEVFERYGQGANYYIETKTTSGGTEMEPELLRLLIAHGLREGAVTKRQVIVQSFAAASLQRMHALDAELPLVLLGAGSTDLTELATYGFGFGPSSLAATQSLIARAHELGLAVHPYTINNQADLSRLSQLCVDGMFTNYPDRYRALIDAANWVCPEPIR